MKIAQATVAQMTQYSRTVMDMSSERTVIESNGRRTDIEMAQGHYEHEEGVSLKLSQWGQLALDEQVNKGKGKDKGDDGVKDKGGDGVKDKGEQDEQPMTPGRLADTMRQLQGKDLKEIMRDYAEALRARIEKLNQRLACPKGSMTQEDVMLRLLEELFSKDGKRMKIRRPPINLGQSQDMPDTAGRMQAVAVAQGQAQAQPRTGFGMQLTASSVRAESESFTFSSQGKVLTEDGREINFQMDFSMSRSFYESKSASLSAGSLLPQRCDPLVINFDGRFPPGVTDVKFAFDLDNDGAEDQISQLTQGNGFLAFDKDNNGTIDNGGELFGPQSGNGFDDLAAYDDDGNGWIDENDDIFNKLRIWTKDDQGNDQLFALGQKGIGAICLMNSATPFTFTPDTMDNANGFMQSTGVFLRENGTAGTIHHIDMAL